MKQEQKCRQLQIDLQNQRLELSGRRSRYETLQDKATKTEHDARQTWTDVMEIAKDAGVDIAFSMMPGISGRGSEPPMPGPVVTAAYNFLKLRNAIARFSSLWKQASELQRNSDSFKNDIKEAEMRLREIEKKMEDADC